MKTVAKEKEKKSSGIGYFMKKNQCLLWIVVIFVLLSVLCYLFPYAGDDWAWGSSIGMDRLKSGFEDYGGRYVGYLIVMGLTRFRILRAVFMAGVMVGIGLCMKKIIKHKWAFFASIAMMLLVSVDIFAQSISWVSGFANYGTTALVVLLFLCVAIDVIIDKKKKYSPLVLLAMLFFAFVGSLIMENVTVYLVLMSIGILLYLWVKEKRFSLPLFLIMLGAIGGAVLMFSNSAYHNIAFQQDDYRTIASSGGGMIKQAIDNYNTSIYPHGLFKNVILNVVFVVGGVLLMIFNKDLRKKIPIGCLTIFGIYTIITIFSELMIGITDKTNLLINIEGVMSLMAIVSLLVFALCVGKNNTDLRSKMILLCVSFVVLIGPLFAITPIGPRNFFVTYMVLVAVCLLEWRLMFEIVKKKNKKLFDESVIVLRKVGMAATLSVVMIMIGIFAIVFRADKNRNELVQQGIADEQQSIVIHHLPFESMMWSVTPGDEIFNERFKLFYKVPKDIEIVVEP